MEARNIDLLNQSSNYGERSRKREVVLMCTQIPTRNRLASTISGIKKRDKRKWQT